MKIYDCFLFNDENHILEIRINELIGSVDYFVIIEFGENHQGKRKGQCIDQNLLKKFKEKIRYYYFDKFDPKMSVWQKENYQRNKINEGLKDANSLDIIIISDVDEIPNLKKINLSKINDQVIAFSQLNSMYKFNLFREDKNWIGSKLCLKKNLVSPQWLRALKVKKKYSFFRIDKIFSDTYYKNFLIIENGGWHFAWLRTADQILKKINAYAHTELNTLENNDIDYIEKCIQKKIVFFNKSEKLTYKKLNHLSLPKFVADNIERYSQWIL